MVKKNVTVSLDEEIYEEYKRYCQTNGVALSRSIEIFMENKMKDGKSL